MPLTPQERRLFETARERVSRGDLPSLIPLRIWGGKGAGDPCSLCGERIERAVAEYEFEEAERTYHFHLRCYAIWQLAIAPPGTDKEPAQAYVAPG